MCNLEQVLLFRCFGSFFPNFVLFFVFLVLFSLEFFISKINFEKAPLARFPYRAYLTHKNDSPNLTKKSSGLLKD